MARDIQLSFNTDTREGDFIYKNGDYAREEGLVTAVMISLFTDRRSSTDDNLDDPNDKRGWWGDLAPDNGDRIGSKLWQYERAKATPENARAIKSEIEDCLKWMIEDGVAKKIEVETEVFGAVGNYRLGCIIKIYKSDEAGVSTIKFDDLWEVTCNAL